MNALEIIKCNDWEIACLHHLNHYFASLYEKFLDIIAYYISQMTQNLSNECSRTAVKVWFILDCCIEFEISVTSKKQITNAIVIYL